VKALFSRPDVRCAALFGATLLLGMIVAARVDAATLGLYWLSCILCGAMGRTTK
jgi:hypothetical protein